MVTRHAALALFLAAAAGAAAGSEWRPLSGEALREALSGRTVVYGPDEQTFLETGRTRYRLLGDRWGWWEVRADRYCSLWPPAEEWTCYAVEAHGDGARLRFTGPDGTVTEGTFGE